jgi:hypothetical protein
MALHILQVTGQPPVIEDDLDQNVTNEEADGMSEGEWESVKDYRWGA